MGELDAKLKLLASARARLDSMKSIESGLESSYMSTPEYLAFASVNEGRRRVEADIKKITDEVRDLAMSEYDGENLPHPGLHRISTRRTLVYDREVALDECVKRGLNTCLKLDASKFKKVAQALEFDFVSWEERQIAEIKSDLSDIEDPDIQYTLSEEAE